MSALAGKGPSDTYHHVGCLKEPSPWLHFLRVIFPDTTAACDRFLFCHRAQHIEMFCNGPRDKETASGYTVATISGLSLRRIKIMNAHGISKHETSTKNFKMYETSWISAEPRLTPNCFSSFSPLLAAEGKGIDKPGSPRSVTVKLWSCSFTVSRSVLSSRVQRACASATSSSLNTKIRLAEQGHQDLVRANNLL